MCSLSGRRDGKGGKEVGYSSEMYMLFQRVGPSESAVCFSQTNNSHDFITTRTRRERYVYKVKLVTICRNEKMDTPAKCKQIPNSLSILRSLLSVGVTTESSLQGHS